MIIDANLYFAHFFSLNKNMYIFIWGESSIKMSEPGEQCHTHRHTHTYACIHKRATVRDCWRNQLLPMAGETQLSPGKLGLGWPGPEPLGWQQSGNTDSLGCSALQYWPFWGGEKGEITPLTRWVFQALVALIKMAGQEKPLLFLCYLHCKHSSLVKQLPSLKDLQ